MIKPIDVLFAAHDMAANIEMTLTEITEGMATTEETSVVDFQNLERRLEMQTAELIYLRGRCEKMFAVLTPRERCILRMQYFERMPYDYIADVVGLSKQKIGSVQAEIIAKLNIDMAKVEA